jgi:acetylornithine deacetylase/succinyl-diaminopimelate desuccinylase-like protein
LKKHSKSSQRSEPTLKRTKARGPVQRDVKEVLAEVLEKLTGKLDVPAVSTSAKENRRLGDWLSRFCQPLQFDFFQLKVQPYALSHSHLALESQHLVRVP